MGKISRITVQHIALLLALFIRNHVKKKYLAENMWQKNSKDAKFTPLTTFLFLCTVFFSIDLIPMSATYVLDATYEVIVCSDVRVAVGVLVVVTLSKAVWYTTNVHLV